MSLIGTEVKPFKAQAYHNGKFVAVTEHHLFLSCGFHICLPDRTGRFAEQL